MNVIGIALGWSSCLCQKRCVRTTGEQHQQKQTEAKNFIKILLSNSRRSNKKWLRCNSFKLLISTRQTFFFCLHSLSVVQWNELNLSVLLKRAEKHLEIKRINLCGNAYILSQCSSESIPLCLCVHGSKVNLLNKFVICSVIK